MKKKIENSEQNLEQVKELELHELRRGKVEALQVLQVISCYDDTCCTHDTGVKVITEICVDG